MDSLGDDVAEERDMKLDVLRQRVEAAKSSEVNQAVGRLLTVLNRDPPCEDDKNTALQTLCRGDVDGEAVDAARGTCGADLNRRDGYGGRDVGHFEGRQRGGIGGATLSSQQLQTFQQEKHQSHRLPNM